MAPVSIRKPLRVAIEELEAAREQLAGTDSVAGLDGIITQLQYYLDGDTRDPEALIYPPPGALDSIQARVTDAIEEADGEAAAHLRKARGRILEVLLALDDRLHEGRSSMTSR